MDSLDLNIIEKTELLTSQAAKDKILIKPKRMSTRQSRKACDIPPLTSLSSLSEGARPFSEVFHSNLASGSAGVLSPEKVVTLEETELSPSSSTSLMILSPAEGKSGVAVRKLHLQFNVTTTKDNNKDLPSPSSLTLSPSAAATPFFKATSPTTPISKFPPQKFAGLRSPEIANPSLSSAQTAASSAPSMSDKKINENTQDDVMDVSSGQQEHEESSSSSRQELDGIRLESYIKTRMNQFQTPVAMANKFGPTATGGRFPLKSTGQDTSVTSPTKEESKVKQWGRSLLPPTSVESQNSSQKANATQAKSTNVNKYPDFLSQKSSDKSLSSSNCPTNQLPSCAKKLESKSESSSTFPVYGQPWRNEVRKEDNENENKKTEDNTQSSTPSCHSLGNNKSSGSVFMSISRMEKKPTSFGVTSNKNQNVPDFSSKKVENSESKKGEPSNENISSTKTESSDLNSVKAFRSLFTSGSQSNNQKTNMAATLVSDRFKPLPGTTSGSTTNKTDSLKMVSNQTPADGSASSFVDVVSVQTSEGANPTHRQSLELTFHKTQEPSSTIQKRGTNFKGSIVLSLNTPCNQSCGAVASTIANKTDAASTSENSETSSSTTSSKTAINILKLPQPNVSLNTQTSPIIAATVRSFNGDNNSKTSTSMSFCSKQAGASTNSKSQTTTTVTSTLPTSTPSAASPAATKFSMANNLSTSSSWSVATSTTRRPVVSNVTDPPSSSSSTTPSFMKSNSSSSGFVKSQTFSNPQNTLQTQTSTQQNQTKFTADNSTEKKSDEPATNKLPAWRANLLRKESNLATLDKSSSSQSSSTSNSEVLKKFSDKGTISDTTKKTESLPNADVIMQVEMASGKASKVFNMIQNFQNLKAPS